MIDLVLLSKAIIFSSLLTLLSIGLTLTYLTTKVPNFAHATFATVGAYVTLTAITLWRGNPYHFLVFAVIIGGTIALFQYLLVFRPLIRRGATVVGLMITTLAIEFILLAVLNIYADILTKEFVRAGIKIRSRYFLLSDYDIEIVGQKGLLVAAPTLAVVAVTLLYLVLTRTKFGVAMRAAIEDPSLASVVGINVNMVYAISWFIAGSLASLSGALLPLYIQCYPEVGARVIVYIFSASIIGGLGSIYGAVLGGYLIGLAEVLGTNELASELGAWVIPYRPLIPLIAIVITLLLASEGLIGINWRGVTKGFWNKIVGFTRSPTETFNAIKDEDSWGSNAMKHFSKLLVIFALLQTLLFTAIPEYYTMITSLITMLIPVNLPVNWPPLLGFISIFMGGIIMIFGGSLLIHMWAYFLGGRKRVRETIKSLAYGSTLFLLLGWVPFLGIVLAIWAMILSIIGIRELHEISMTKAVAAFILGAVVAYCVLFGSFALLFA